MKMRLQWAMTEEFEYRVIFTFLNPNADITENETELCAEIHISFSWTI